MMSWVLAALCLVVIGTTAVKPGAPSLGVAVVAAAILAVLWVAA